MAKIDPVAPLSGVNLGFFFRHAPYPCVAETTDDYFALPGGRFGDPDADEYVGRVKRARQKRRDEHQADQTGVNAPLTHGVPRAEAVLAAAQVEEVGKSYTMHLDGPVMRLIPFDGCL